MDLIADVGATNSRCALLDDQGQVAKSESFENADFTGLPGLLRIFLEHRRASDQPILAETYSMRWTFADAQTFVRSISLMSRKLSSSK